MTFTKEELDIIEESLPCYIDSLEEDLEESKRAYEHYKKVNNVESVKILQGSIKSQEEELYKVRELHDKLLDISDVDMANKNRQKYIFKILKEKKVDIGYIAMMISNCETQELGSGIPFNVNDYIQEITDCYNKHIAIQQNVEYKFLTQEEMSLIVGWSKED